MKGALLERYCRYSLHLLYVLLDFTVGKRETRAEIGDGWLSALINHLRLAPICAVIG